MIIDRIGHGWHVLGTLLLGGALFAFAWGLSQSGQLDIAATGLSVFLLTMGRSFAPGVISRIPEFAGTSTLIKQAHTDFSAWLASRRLLTRALIALGAALAFLAFRAVFAWGLAIIASPWMALALGLGVAALVAAPTLLTVAKTFLAKASTGD